jgi:sugar lactone lactonase YvrE
VRARSPLALALALCAAAPASAAAPTAGGMRHQRSIYADAADVALKNPEGVACDERGAVVVADTGNARLLTFTWKDGALQGGAQVKLQQLRYPVRVAIDSKGFVLALDRRERRIVRLDAKGEFASYAEPKGVTPAAFKLDASDRLYVLDLAAGKVVVAAPDGRIERELPLPRARGLSDVAVDGGGRVYVVDAVGATVFVAEKGATVFTPLSASLKEVMSFPTYLAPDGRGKLLLVDQNGNAIVRLGLDGKFQGRDLATGWSDGALYYPGQLCVSGDGDVLVADRNNHRVQIFTAAR